LNAALEKVTEIRTKLAKKKGITVDHMNGIVHDKEA